MKKKLLNNIGLKLISVAAAVIIWLIIINIDDPETSKTITLTVQEINAEDLASLKKTYEVVSGETATARIKGRTSVIKDLDSSDFKAIADLSKLSDTGAVWVDIVANDYVNTREVEIVPGNNVYKVATENLVEKSFSVVVNTRGKVASGYYKGEVKATPNMIKITGSETKISNIKEVAVTVDISGASSNIASEGLEPVVYGLNGAAMDTSRLSMDIKDGVDVSVTMLRTKTVPVRLTYKGDAADGYAVLSKESAEESVTIAGTKADLDKVSALNVECSIEGETSDIEKTILYKDFLPENIVLAEGDVETAGIAVKVVIEPVITRMVDVRFEDIELTGASDELDYSVYSETDEVSISVSGAKSYVDALKPEDLKVKADVSGYGAGTHLIRLDVTTSASVTVGEYQQTTIRIQDAES